MISEDYNYPAYAQVSKSLNTNINRWLIVKKLLLRSPLLPDSFLFFVRLHFT